MDAAPKSGRQNIRDFLLTNGGKADLVEQAMTDLEPFFLAAESGSYPLKSTNELSDAEIAKAIGLAINCQVAALTLISRARCRCDANFASQGLCSTLDRVFWSKLEEATNPIALATLKTIIWEDLEKSLRLILPDGLNDITSARVRVNVGASLRYYLGFILAGDRETTTVNKLRPLIQLLPSAIPLDAKTNQGSTWSVMVA